MNNWKNWAIVAGIYFTVILFVCWTVTLSPISPSVETNNGVYCGTAFYVGPNTVITAEHVVRGQQYMDTRIGKSNRMTVVYKSTSNDIAVLRTKHSSSSWLSLGYIVNGQKAKIVGYPRVDIYGTSIKTSYGTAWKANNNTIQFKINIWPGNSGSPVLNNNNEVIGTATAGYDAYRIENKGSSMGLGAADTVIHKLVPDLPAKGNTKNSIVYICGGR